MKQLRQEQSSSNLQSIENKNESGHLIIQNIKGFISIHENNIAIKEGFSKNKKLSSSSIYLNQKNAIKVINTQVLLKQTLFFGYRCKCHDYKAISSKPYKNLRVFKIFNLSQILTYLSSFNHLNILPIKRAQQLQSLSIEFGGVFLFKENDDIYQQSLFQFSKILNISHKNKIHNLDLNFDNFSYLQDSTIFKIGKCIAKLGELIYLKICLNRCKLHLNQGLIGIAEGIQDLRKLKNIVIGINCSSDTNREAFVKLIHSCIHNRKSLSSFEIGLNKLSIVDDQFFEIFSKVLITSPSLVKLGFSIHECEEISFYGLQQLGDAFSIMGKQIKELDLFFGYNQQFTEEEYVYMPTILKLLENLIIVDLDFSQLQNFTDDDLQRILVEFPKLRNLQTLKISIYNCQKISDISLVNMKRCLEKTQKINTVKYCLTYCHGLTSEEFVKELIQNVVQNANIIHFTIELKSSFLSYTKEFKKLLNKLQQENQKLSICL